MRCKNFFCCCCCCCSRCRKFLFPHSCTPSHTFPTPSGSSLFTREVKRVPCVINKASHMKFYVWRYNNPAAAAFVFMCMHIRYTHLQTLHTWESQDSLRCTWWYLMLWLLMWKDWRWGNTTMHCDCTLKCRRKRVFETKGKNFCNFFFYMLLLLSSHTTSYS